ncbi:MAG: murB [Anaerocolumna sp.]|nr:murB [Anaerocolumna sp.]
MNEAFYQKLMQVVNKNQILIEEPLARHTTFQVGGPAQFLIVPESITQIKELVDLCTKEDMDLFVMGNGSNLLVSDIGFRGVVIKLCHVFSNIAISKIDFDNTKEYLYTLPEQLDKNETWYQVTAESGVMLSKLANLVADESLEGFEFAAGIPGTLGGAVTMNAGAYDGEIKNSIIGATVLDRKGNIYKLNKEELKLGYRKSIIQDNNYIVLDATFLFKIGKKEEIRNKINDLNARRRDKQPLEYPSAGSTFKRPNGYFAGKLIMDSGLRGYQLGNAQVSEKHCGFVINRGGATAAEVRALISEIIRIVYEKHGVMLEPEVKLLGEF